MNDEIKSTVHLWLLGDRVVCLNCGLDADDIEFVEPGHPLCGECRSLDPHEWFGRVYCPEHRRETR